MPEWIDDCGGRVEVDASPSRIICLCPSLTETLFSLGLKQRIVGRTRYCIHPAPDVESIAVVGGTKQLDDSAIAKLMPDLILAEKEENRREDVEALRAAGWPVFVANIESVDQALASIRRLGAVLGAESEAQILSNRILSQWQNVPQVARPLRVLYLIWRKPWMAAGSNTYIDSVLQRCGLQNVATAFPGRYPQISKDEIQALDVDLCLLSSEPFPFHEGHIAELAALRPDLRVELVDGEMFSWYGSRMEPAAAYLKGKVADWS